MTLKKLRKEIWDALYLVGDINIKVKCRGIHIALSLKDDRDVEYFINKNVEKYNEEYKKLFITHTIQ